MEKTNFSTAKTLVAVRPKSVAESAFVYRGTEDLQNLIKYVGKPATLNSNLEVTFKKHIIKPGSLVFCPTEGNVTKVVALSYAENLYDIAAQKDFEPGDAVPAKTAPKTEKK